MGWVPQWPSMDAGIYDQMNRMDPVTDWIRTFVFYKKMKDGPVWLRFMYKRKYANMYGNYKWLYRETLFDIIKS